MDIHQLSGKNIKCICNVGYGGKYCDKWYCNKDCNNKGVCEGPNNCHCYPHYKGKRCDMYQVDTHLSPAIGNHQFLKSVTIIIIL
ncbi:hypothetical protein HZS_5218 [Henneguya salminicola]|nr:hypothetical protein HZS_5218 [Henneguya salminicola]